MKSNVVPAIILAVALVVAGLLAGGRYSVVATTGGSVARLDRLTGAVAMCVPGTRAECEWMLDPPTAQPARLPPTLSDDQMRALEKAGIAQPAGNSN